MLLLAGVGLVALAWALAAGMVLRGLHVLNRPTPPNPALSEEEAA